MPSGQQPRWRSLLLEYLPHLPLTACLSPHYLTIRTTYLLDRLGYSTTCPLTNHPDYCPLPMTSPRWATARYVPRGDHL